MISGQRRCHLHAEVQADSPGGPWITLWLRGTRFGPAGAAEGRLHHWHWTAQKQCLPKANGWGQSPQQLFSWAYLNVLYVLTVKYVRMEFLIIKKISKINSSPGRASMIGPLAAWLTDANGCYLANGSYSQHQFVVILVKCCHLLVWIQRVANFYILNL